MLKNILPVAQFFTTEHTTLSISRFLMSINNTFKHCHKSSTDSFSIAPVIVTDESWAMINAINQIFNNVSTANYIMWTFQAIVEYPLNFDISLALNVSPILCHVHFLKNAVRKVKMLNLEKNAKKIFIYGFIGLQNSTDIKEFNELLICLHTIFNIQYCKEEKIHKCIRIIQRSSNCTSNFNNFDDFYDLLDKKYTSKEDLKFLYITDDFYGKNLNFEYCTKVA